MHKRDAWYVLQSTNILDSGIVILTFQNRYFTINTLPAHCNTVVAWPYKYLEPKEGLAGALSADFYFFFN